ncbi:MAG: hypothetical protein AAF471_05995, partial [Myxococcota bacterium]
VPEIEEAFAVLEEIGLDRHELELYRKVDMARRDRASQLETSYDKGHKKGVAEGERREKQRIALEMLSSGMDAGTVAKITGLPPAKIGELRDERDRHS